MGYFAAFGYKTYMKLGSSASAAPGTSTAMTEIKNLSNAGLQSSSDTTDVITYDTSTMGWKASLVTANSYTVDCTLNIDVKDAGYKLLKAAARDSASGVMVEWFRETPLAGSAGAAGPAAGFTIIGNGTSGGTAGTVTGLTTTTTGTGTGLTVDVVVAAGGTVSSIVPKNPGTGYHVGDVITVAKALIPTVTTDVTATVQSVSGTGTKETHAGVAAVSNFSEAIEAGSVAAITFTLQGYGAYIWSAAV